MPKLRVKRHAVTQPLNESYRLIPLTQDQNAIVDATDFDWLNQWNWCAHWNPNTKSFYATRGIWDKRKKCIGTIKMANEIIQCKPGNEPDHKNHDTLDNRRQNLRESTQSQNRHNQKMRSNNTSGFIGISWCEKKNKWRAAITHKKIRIHLGYFKSKEEAARTYDKAAKKYHGEFAVLNFIEHTPSF